MGNWEVAISLNYWQRIALLSCSQRPLFIHIININCELPMYQTLLWVLGMHQWINKTLALVVLIYYQRGQELHKRTKWKWAGQLKEQLIPLSGKDCWRRWHCSRTGDAVHASQPRAIVKGCLGGASSPFGALLLVQLRKRRWVGKTGTRKVGIRVSGTSPLPYPQQSCLRVTFLRMTFSVPNLLLSNTKSWQFCLFKTSHITPVPRHCPVQVVTVKFWVIAPDP